MLRKTLYVLIIISLLVSGFVRGNNVHFSHFSINDGLSYSHITAIRQDIKGYMWIGTRKGLFRYDGYTISQIKTEKDLKHGYNSNYIREISVRSNGDVWALFNGEILKYDPAKDLMITIPIINRSLSEVSTYNDPVVKLSETKDGRFFLLTSDCLYILNQKGTRFEPYSISNENSLVQPFYEIVSDNQNGLWIVGSKSLYHINLNSNTTSQFDIKKYFKDGKISRVKDMLIDSENNIWIATFGEGLLMFDTNKDKFELLNKKTGYDIAIVRVLYEDNQKQLWLGGENGIRVLNIQTKKLVKVFKEDYQNVLGINDDALYSIFQDKNLNLWFGTYFGGINILFKEQEQFNYYPAGYRPGNVSGKAVRQIIEDGELLWIATEDGGLNKFNKKTQEFKHFKDLSNESKIIRSNNIHALLKDRNNNLWIGTFDDGVNVMNLKSGAVRYINTGNTPELKSDMVFSLLEDADGIIYFGTSNGLTLYDPVKNKYFTIDHPVLKNRFIYNMTIDSKNNIWFATRQDGLIFYNKKKNIIKHFISNSQQGTIKDNFITKVYEDSYHNIWVGTNSEGLYFYNVKNDRFQLVLNTTGISISSVVEDNNKTLWVSTEKGLIKYNLQNKKLFKYTKDDGFYSDNFNANSALKSKEGKLYFGTTDGLISFDPVTIKENNYQPNIVFSKLYIGGEEVTVSSKNSPIKAYLDELPKIILSHEQARSFAIEYAAIFYGHTKSIKYEVFMEGIDKNWNMLNDQRRVNYSKLPSGKYIFKVRAISSNGSWDKAPVRSIIIIVKPPFYLSIWAWIIYLALISTIVYFTFRFLRIRQQEKQLIQLERIERTKIEEINRTKIDFFTNISHELKTPLTLIISPLQRLIIHDLLSDSMKETMDVVLRNAQRMSRIVDELMTFSKIEIGREKLMLRKGNVLEFVSNISNTFKLLAREKNIDFTPVIEDNGEEVWFSITNIEKIIYNLLSNSFKFTSGGGSISIQARLIENSDNKIFLNILVSDTGEGIHKQFLDRIFENYFQADPNSNIRGSGIGLALTKRLVNLHKGTIEVDSIVGKGSTFEVMIDVSQSSYSKEELATEIFDKDYFNKYNYITIEKEVVEKSKIFLKEEEEVNIKTILLVDDNEELLKFLCDIFKDKYRILSAVDGEIALEIANREYPDLIVSDVMMPNMDGYEFCRRIKNDFTTCHIPVILLTAKTGSEDKLEGYEVGADFYVEKPFDARMLEMQVQNIIKTHLNNIELLKNNHHESVSNELLNERDCSFVKKLNDLIHENIDNQFFSISDVTKSLNVSRTLLHVKCKKLIDTSVTDYIREIRMHKAKGLLIAGHNISETAYAVGFSDPGYFSKVFRKQFNISPSDFIKNLVSSVDSN